MTIGGYSRAILIYQQFPGATPVRFDLDVHQLTMTRSLNHPDTLTLEGEYFGPLPWNPDERMQMPEQGELEAPQKAIAP